MTIYMESDMYGVAITMEIGAKKTHVKTGGTHKGELTQGDQDRVKLRCRLDGAEIRDGSEMSSWRCRV